MIRPRIGLVVIGVVILAIVGWSVVGQLRTVQAQDQQAATEQTLSEVADPLAALCAENPAIRARVGPACNTAAAVVSAPPEDPAAGLDGRPGTNGTDGRGITSTLLRADGHLVLTYSDGSTNDVGLVVGQSGGAGSAGVGITSATTQGGRLVLSFSDGSNVDVGRIVGDPGRGVSSTAIVDGRLIVSYDDGTTQDAGELPPGPAGRDAELPSSYTRTFSDGTSEACTRAGGAETSPVYSCTDRA